MDFENTIFRATGGAITYDAQVQRLAFDAGDGQNWWALVPERELRGWMCTLLWNVTGAPLPGDPVEAAATALLSHLRALDAVGADPLARFRGAAALRAVG